jgi:hypothetical protein
MHIKNKVITENFQIGAPFCPDTPPFELGTFTISPARVRCDEPYVLNVTYTVGEAGIRQGGGLQIRFPGVQSDSPSAKRYIAATCSNPAAQFRFVHKTYPRVFITTPDTLRPNVNWHAAVLRGADLKEGDVITIIIGTAAVPVVGPEKRYKFDDTKVLLQHAIDTAGSGEYILLANSPHLDVQPAESTQFKAFLPSIVRPGSSLIGRGALLDDYGTFIKHPESVVVVSDGQPMEHFTVPDGESVLRLELSSKDPDFQIRANPVLVRENPKMQLYWGDIHFHSNLSHDVVVQGIENTPEDSYRYGREVSGLDFACLTDHYEPVVRTWLPMRRLGAGLTEELWEQSKDTTDRMDCPGEFVTFFGYEYLTQRGHTNIYFSKREGAPLLPGQVDCMSRVREFLGNTEYFSAPHLHPYSHQYLTFGPWKWGKEVIEQWQDIGGDSEPIIEIFSNHGRYEFYGNQPHGNVRRGMTEGNTVQAHLLRGHRFGIYGGSDDHWGRPGKSGITAVYAPELTREAIFDALRNRRCYGTTNARIIVDFHVNGRFMGESCFSNERTKICGEVHGTDKIARIEIIRDGRIIHMVEPDGEDCTIEYEDTMPVLGTCFYYLRVLQRDQHMAWSSPVWVTSMQRIEDMHGDMD